MPARSPRLITRPIEDIRPGMRVLASNPESAETQPDSAVTPDDWRLVSLTMTKENGGKLQVQLLRPLEWFLSQAIVLIRSTDDPQSLYQSPVLATAAKDSTDYKLQTLLLKQQIYLDLPELGAQGMATVTAIDACPSLDAAETGRRMVTGTFRHAATNVIDLQVGCESEPFGCTDNHPFWSVDRHEFVEAGQLRIGENLQSADGTLVQVTWITPRRGPPVDVFNFEVDVDHVYHVGSTGVLVHNACALPVTRSAQHGSDMHHANMVAEALMKKATPGITNVRTNQALSDGTRTLSNLRPDVQWMEDGKIFVIEINRAGGTAYEEIRREQIRGALGDLFGDYEQLDID